MTSVSTCMILNISIDEYYVAYKPIILPCIFFTFIQVKFINCHSCVMFAMKSMSICKTRRAAKTQWQTTYRVSTSREERTSVIHLQTSISSPSQVTPPDTCTSSTLSSLDRSGSTGTDIKKISSSIELKYYFWEELLLFHLGYDQII